jgi:8-oxo-dGTP diphosphatase
MIEVLAAIIVQENRVLIARRKMGKHLSGFWEFPGGKLEKGENDISCLRREIKEEIAIDIKVTKHFMNNEHSYGEKQILLKSYICEAAPNQEFLLTDHDMIEWVEKNNLLNYKIAPADIPIVQALMNE